MRRAALSIVLLVTLGFGAGPGGSFVVGSASAARARSCFSPSGPQTAYVATEGGQLSAIALPGGHQEWSVHLPRSFSVAMSVTLAPCHAVGYVLARSRYKGPAALIPFALSDGSLGHPIPIGLPGAVAISPNGSMAYVANSGGLEGLLAPIGVTVTPVNLSTGHRLRAIGVGGQPGGIAISPSGSTLLVPLTKGSVVPISTATRRVGRPIRLPASSHGLTDPGPIAIDANADVALVSNLAMDLVVPANVINVINLRTLRPEPPISFEGYGDAAGELVISGRGTTAFALSVYGLTTVDLADRTLGSTVPNTYGGDAIALSTGGQTLYLAQQLQTSGSQLVPIDTTTLTGGTPIATFSGQISDIAIGR
jgi:hypothetical protein